MGKTYRKGDERRKRAMKGNEQPQRITPEWALERMEPAVDYAVNMLVDTGSIRPDEMDDCAQEIRLRIVKAAGKYDKERLGATGRKASAVHYFRVVIDSTIKNIVRASVTYANDVKKVQIDETDEGGIKPQGEYVRLSDEAKSIRELEWNMDMETLRELMTPRQRAAFNLMGDGHTAEFAMDEVGVFGGSFYRNIIHPMRKILRKCGYAPFGQNTDC